MSLIDFFLRWFAPGAFTGVGLSTWLRVLRDNRCAIDPPYWPRAAMITATAAGNSLACLAENAIYGRRIQAAEAPPPLFVLGVWRSGTTHLQNLLAVDPRFATPNFYQTVYPHTFLTGERLGARVMDFFLPSRRFQDNVAFGASRPSEDELAIVALTGRSMLMSMVFPRNAAYYDRLLTFAQACEAEIRQWQAALLWFVKKLSFKYGKPLVLKSPGHTGRIRLLLELFPDARFVNIHRHPLDVFRSTDHTVRMLSPYWRMQRGARPDPEEANLRQYQELCDAYFDQRSLIREDRLCEVAYEQLEADPVGQMRRIYESLGLPDFAEVEPQLKTYVDSLTGYRKNVHADLSPELRRRIVQRWRRSFEEWGYNADA